MKNTIKKALSLLVVFAMVCVPMVATAAVGDAIAMPEWCIYSGEYVTVEAGATVYFEIGTGMDSGTYGFVVEGEGDFDVAICTEGVSEELPYAEGEFVPAVDGKFEGEITSYESTYSYAAFAITNNSASDVDYLVTILFPEGTVDNPKEITLNVGDSAEVTVPAGASYYVSVNLPMAMTEFALKVTGATGFTVGAGMGMPAPDNAGVFEGSIAAFFGPATFSITNNTDSEQTYVVSLDNMPVGATEANPEIIEASGDYTTAFVSGHYYAFTAPEAGMITVTMNSEDWMYQILGERANGDYYIDDMHWCDDDPVVASKSVNVSADDVMIIIAGPYMTEDNVDWSFEFTAGASVEEDDPVTPPVDDPVTPPAAGYDENGPVFYLEEGTVSYFTNPNYTYSLYGFAPEKEGKYTISSESLIGIVSYNGMWVTVEPSAETITENSFEWECTSVGQSIWVAVATDAESVEITVSYEETVVVVVPESDYENIADVKKFENEVNTDNFDYVDTDDDILDSAVLGEDGYYHLNSADGPILFACLNDSILSLADANSYGQLNYVEYDEDGNAVSKTHYAAAFEEYVANVFTDGGNSMYYPLTVDLITMFQNIGKNNGWYGENGFVGGLLDDAWMFACYYDEDLTSFGSSDDTSEDVSDDISDDSSEIVEDSSEIVEDSSEEESATPEAGDSSAIIVLAILAIVALAGSVVVVKARK